MQTKLNKILSTLLGLSMVLASCNLPAANPAGALPFPAGSMAISVFVIASKGATLTLPNGARAMIPAGALPEDTTVTFSAPDTGIPVSSIFDGQISVGLTYLLDLGGQILNSVITLELPYDLKKLPQGSNPAGVAPSEFDNQNGIWNMVQGSVSEQNHVITFKTKHAGYARPVIRDWSRWPDVLNNLLVTVQKETGKVLTAMQAKCNQADKNILVVQRDGETVLMGCIEQSDPINPVLRLANPSKLTYRINFPPGLEGYPAPKMFSPGEVLSFSAKQQDLKPLTVTFTFDKAAVNSSVAGLLFSILPDVSKLDNPDSIAQFGVITACVADILQSRPEFSNLGIALIANQDKSAAVDTLVSTLQSTDSISTLIAAAKQCGYTPATSWDVEGIKYLASRPDILTKVVDFYAAGLPGATSGAVDFTAPQPPTATTTAPIPGTPTPTATITPTASATMTEAPAPVSKLRGNVLEHLACRYGPDNPYLYKYGILPGTVMEAIGRDADGDWLQVQAIGGHNPCWLKASQMKVSGDVMALPDTYPYTNGLPISPFFERVAIVSVSGGTSGTVNVEWNPHKIRADINSGEGIEYVIEVWTCVNGKPAFYAVGFPIGATSGSYQVDDSCGVPTHVDIIGEDKEGFSLPTNITH